MLLSEYLNDNFPNSELIEYAWENKEVVITPRIVLEIYQKFKDEVWSLAVTRLRRDENVISVGYRQHYYPDDFEREMVKLAIKEYCFWA
jgi:hypothetical protein